MTGLALEFPLLTASIQSRGLALSEWADALPEPWSQVLRWLPISGAFLLGLLVVVLWKRKTQVESTTQGGKGNIKLPAASAKSPAEEKLPLLQNELKVTLEKNQRQKIQIDSAQRALEVKDLQVEELQSQLSAAQRVERDEDQAKLGRSLSMLASASVIEPREDLQEFVSASEQLAQAAADFRNNLRAEPSLENGGAAFTDIDPVEVKTEKSDDWQEFLLFRSCEPSIWNHSVNENENHCAISLDQVPADVAFLRLRRLDSGQGLVIPLQIRDLTQDGGENLIAFNGSNEEFYGARHLGIYSESLPQEVEIRFALGGWGFGHCSDSGDSKPAQACAWAGQKINADTVLEITVYPRLPELTDDDQLLPVSK